MHVRLTILAVNKIPDHGTLMPKHVGVDT